MRFHGQVVRHPVARGSKSERRAVLLRTADAEYVLRRRGGNPFVDRVLEELVGQWVDCDGEVHEGVLLLDAWTVAG